jgi:hypothetical protein
MDQFTRRLVGVGVHRGAVDGADLCRMFNAAIQGRGAPRHLSTDHDPLFEAHRWTANLRILTTSNSRPTGVIPGGMLPRHPDDELAGPPRGRRADATEASRTSTCERLRWSNAFNLELLMDRLATHK